MQSATPAPASAPAPTPRRFLSVDALRGFDMLWIVGAGSIIHALFHLAERPENTFWHSLLAPLTVLQNQFTHKDWEGFAFYDLIFPLFVFMVGVSVVFSLGRAKGEEGMGAAYARILRRFVLLYFVALFYSGGFSKLWPDIRLMGVLNRIALCYLFASLAFCHLKTRGIAVFLATVLLGYWALMAWVPFPDLRPRDASGKPTADLIEAKSVNELNWSSQEKVHGVYQPGFNLAHYLDQRLLPGKKWNDTWDPEGLLSTLPAIGTCLLGVLAGLLLKNSNVSDQQKVFILAGAGVASVALGFLWGTQFPVIKKIWTSSYVLVAGGYSALLLAFFHQVVEVWKFQTIVQPFLWVGSNAITIYLGKNLIDFRGISERFAGGNVKQLLDNHVALGMGDLVLACVNVFFILLFVRFLYRRKIFLRL